MPTIMLTSRIAIALCLVAAPAFAQIPADPKAFWDARGGVMAWCRVAETAQIQQELYPAPRTKVSVFVVEHYERGALRWRARFSGDRKLIYWGPIPIEQERRFETAVAYLKAACRL